MKLSDAVWIAPLLEAVARGETLETNVGTKTQPEWVPITNEAVFTGYRENYRIKPKVHEYRLYNRAPGSLTLCCTERNSGNAGLERHRLYIEQEALKGTVQWVGPWTPVPQE